MTYTYSMFVRDEYLGDGVVSKDVRLGLGPIPGVPHSTMYLCHKCGEVWARVAVADPASTWFASHVPCDRCGVGRLSIEYWFGELGAPQKWWEREFLLAAEYGEWYWDYYGTTRERTCFVLSISHHAGKYVPPPGMTGFVAQQTNNLALEF